MPHSQAPRSRGNQAFVLSKRVFWLILNLAHPLHLRAAGELSNQVRNPRPLSVLCKPGKTRVLARNLFRLQEPELVMPRKSMNRWRSAHHINHQLALGRLSMPFQGDLTMIRNDVDCTYLIPSNGESSDKDNRL